MSTGTYVWWCCVVADEVKKLNGIYVDTVVSNNKYICDFTGSAATLFTLYFGGTYSVEISAATGNPD
jgi:hypothetical protein